MKSILRNALVFLITYLLLNSTLFAQEIQGTVADLQNRELLEYVEIININNQQKTLTNKRGEFKIQAAVNHVLVFIQAGYHPDTVLIINLKPLKRYLRSSLVNLNMVEIKGIAFDPREEYIRVYGKGKAFNMSVNKPLSFSPWKYFSYEGKSARKFKRKMKIEWIEKEIDKRFNNTVVRAICPLEKYELDAFMVRYRPTLKELERMDHDQFKLYLLDAYKQFKELPEAERRLPSLMPGNP
ncbi:carboxypeptidase-like regulatory domain-containing protein [Pedobacter gandavensis]|uniref:carboxypeptidase-like regulatory domain-containing protein n=1 Tax=Pedobacter gandavensis TaxID=2679963 RepID=UPI00292E9D48|nr:carboxypeptidase-like regulatory domain-containing protein [Pedobacter gandavensis]